MAVFRKEPLHISLYLFSFTSRALLFQRP